MNAVKQIIDSTALNGIVPLPKLFLNRKVEIIISLVEDEAEISAIQVSPNDTENSFSQILNDSHQDSSGSSRTNYQIIDIDELLHGTVTESLIGAVPNTTVSLDEYRTERLSKYECVD